MSEIIVQGITIGSIYAMVAVSFNVIYRPTNIFNFAQGDLLMVGAMIAATLARSYGFPWYGAAAISIVAVALLAVLIEMIAVSPIIIRSPGSGTWIISTLCASIIIHEVTDKIAGPDPRVMAPPPPLSTTLMKLGEVSISSFQIGLVVFVLLLVGATEFYYRTRSGRAVRAIAEDRDASLLRGIDPKRITRLSFVFGGVIAAVAGILAAPILFASTGLGSVLLLKGFLVVALGGIGSNSGAVVAALTVGFVEATSAHFLTPGLQEGVSFAAVLTILLIRPQGLFGTMQSRAV